MRKTDKNLRDSFKTYKQVSEDPVDIRQYLEIASGLNQFLMDKVLEGWEVILPERMGTVSVIGMKQEIRFDADGNPILPPDWVETKKLWERCPECKENRQRVFHTNDHSGGVRYKFLWSRRRVLVSNKSLYGFRLTRANKRAISDSIKNGKEYYIKDK